MKKQTTVNIDVDFKSNPQQGLAMKYLLDTQVTDLLFGGGCGGGKCVIYNTLVSLSDGSTKEIKELKKGDSVLTVNEKCEVIASRVRGVVKAGRKVGFKFTVHGGSNVTVSKEHPFLIYNNGIPKWVKAMDLKEGMSIAVPQKTPCIGIDKYSLEMYEFLGYLIGNGGLTNSIIISMGDNESVHRMKELLPEGYTLTPLHTKGQDFGVRYYGRNSKGVGINPLYEEIKRLGLACKSIHKRLPAEFMQISEKAIYALMSGILATDGYISNCNLGLCLSSEGLILDIQRLLLCVGIHVNVSHKYPKCNGKVFEAWVLTICRHEQLKQIYDNCNLGGKHEKLRVLVEANKKMIMGINYEYQVNNVRFRRIKTIENIGVVMMYDIETGEGSFIGGGIVLHNSFVGCAWLIAMCIRFPGTRWLMGRSKLKSLQETTLVTFMDVCQMWGLESGVHYLYNAKTNVISFAKDYGGSMILLKDLFSYPSDPEFDSLGSLEISGCFIDEAAQVSAKAHEIVRSRIRYKLDCFCPYCATPRTGPLDFETKTWTCTKCGKLTKGLIPKILMTCNPTKNWIYTEFYKPWKNGTLPPNHKFVPSLAKDNHYIQSSYLDNLRGLTGTNRERLLEGSWEYSEDTWSLIDYDAIMDIFTNDVPPGKRIITADIARQGRDKTVVGVWDGLRLIKIYTLDKNTIPEAVELITEVRFRYGVHLHHIYIDADGIGASVTDLLSDTYPIINNSPAIYVDSERENFGNLKSQLQWYLAEYINKRKIWVVTDENRDKIVQELEWCRQKSADHDGKFYVLPKQDIRDNLGRSTDLLDMMSFRMVHELNDGSLFL